MIGTEPRLFRDDALMLLTAAIWGFAFVAQRLGMEHIGPFTFNGIRFVLGACSLLPLLLASAGRRGTGRRAARAFPLSRRGVGAGVLAGVVLFAGASLQQIGLVHTTAGKGGFITGLYVVLVPISGLLWRQKAGPWRWAGAVLAAGGLYLLSVTGGFTMARGDFLVLLSALFWTAHVQVLGWLSPRVDSMELSFVQFLVCGALSLAAAFLAEPLRGDMILRAAVPILYGGVGSVGIAYTLQVVAQKTAHPAHAAILLSLEGVFAALGGWLVLGESLSPRGLAGCVLMLAGMLSSQAPLLLPGRAPPCGD